jgi:hypothetical protein
MAEAAIGIGSALIGGYFQDKAAGKAADATTNASQQAIAAQQAALAQMRGDLMPYTQGGLQGLGALLGNKYEQSPGYAYQKQEMMSGLNADHAARGSLYSGGTDIDRMRHLQGLAAQDYGNWWNRNLGLAQLGQSSAAGVGNAGMSAANATGGYLGAAGLGQANAAIMQGNNWANTAQQLGTGLSGLLGQSSYKQPGDFSGNPYAH